MRKTIGGRIRILVLAITGCSTLAAHAQESDRRVALVIGNTGYKQSSASPIRATTHS